MEIRWTPAFALTITIPTEKEAAELKQVLIVEDQRMPRKYMESMISDSKYYALR